MQLNPVTAAGMMLQPTSLMGMGQFMVDSTGLGGHPVSQLGGSDKPTDPENVVDEARLMNGSETRTTFMVRNIPNKYTQQALLEEISQFRGHFDFLYVPINSKRGCNIGYAFVNFVSPQAALPFFRAFKSRQWVKAKAPKLSKLAFARLQGRPALITHFQNTLVASHINPDYRPLLFVTQGPRKGEIEPFPLKNNSQQSTGQPNESDPKANPFASLSAFQ